MRSNARLFDEEAMFTAISYLFTSTYDTNIFLVITHFFFLSFKSICDICKIATQIISNTLFNKVAYYNLTRGKWSTLIKYMLQ